LLLVDRVVALAEEGIDVAVRIGALPDSALHVRVVGHVRHVVCASPAYLARRGEPRAPPDLAGHDAIGFEGTSPIHDRWPFVVAGRRERGFPVRARLLVNDSAAAVEAATQGLGLVRALSYQVATAVARRRLRVVLAAFESAPAPVQLLYQPGLL